MNGSGICDARSRRAIQNSNHQSKGRSMANREALAWNTKAPMGGIIAETMARPLDQRATSDDFDGVFRSGAREETWAAGFVTSEGTHIPLFVRASPRDCERHSQR